MTQLCAMHHFLGNSNYTSSTGLGVYAPEGFYSSQRYCTATEIGACTPHNSGHLLFADRPAMSQDAKAEETKCSPTTAAPYDSVKGMPGTSEGDAWAEDSAAPLTALVCAL